MKRLLKILSVSIMVVLTSCATMKEKKHIKEMHLSTEETARFDVKGDSILYDSYLVAYVNNVEWEYVAGSEMRMEISLTQINPYDTNITKKLIKFVHARHPRAKIEVNFDDDDDVDYD